jgi:N-acetylglucosamine-6-phosphate deacetylase
MTRPPTACWSFQGSVAGGADGLAVDNGRIAAYAARGARRICLPDGWCLAPGFWDLQVNGAAGAEIGDDPEQIAAVAAALPSFGVTGFCPTVITRPPTAYRRARSALAAVAWPADGARPLGVHLEGPFLSPARAGAHPAGALRTPTPAALEDLLAAFSPRIVTIAPETGGGLDAIAAIHRAGIVAAVGHTTADADLCRAAIAQGARMLTHALNAMPGITARDPGPLGAFLDAPGTWVGVIADAVHLDPAVLRIVAAAAGSRLIAVSDAVAAAGAGPGAFGLAGRTTRSDGLRVRDVRGRLAGSACGLDAAPANLLAAGRSVAAALAAVTTAPRRMLGAARPLAPGAPADLVILDGALAPQATLIDGVVVWQRPGGALDLS